ncbi:hypothetical protein AB0J81_28480 [Streptomyces bobili]|uniref:hypothetical protein n=1 Tax=Streptomyces bobili TaxID=67280 RepID=UPI003417E7F6
MKDIRQPAHQRGRGPGRLAALLLVLAVMLGLSGGTSAAATDDTAEPTRSTVRVPARAMDAVATMQPTTSTWATGLAGTASPPPCGTRSPT